MLAENLRVAPLPQAVQRTFDGKHPCQLCKEIAQGKQSEKKSEFPLGLNKFEFSYSASVFVFTPPGYSWELRFPESFCRTLGHAPPAPPPRSLLG